MLGLDTHPLGQEALTLGSGCGSGGGLRSVLQIVPASKRVQFFTSHLPKGFAVDMTTQPPSRSEVHKTKHKEFKSAVLKLVMIDFLPRQSLSNRLSNRFCTCISWLKYYSNKLYKKREGVLLLLESAWQDNFVRGNNTNRTEMRIKYRESIWTQI